MNVKFGDIPLTGDCPIRDVLDRIGDRWSVLVLWMLQDGTLRFMEIKRGIPDVSQRMLAKTLRCLEEDGLVERRVHAVVPPKVEYSLSPLGRSLMQPMGQLIDWAAAHHDRVKHARSDYAARAA